jgi:hypothetical protein
MPLHYCQGSVAESWRAGLGSYSVTTKTEDGEDTVFDLTLRSSLKGFIFCLPSRGRVRPAIHFP